MLLVLADVAIAKHSEGNEQTQTPQLEIVLVRIHHVVAVAVGIVFDVGDIAMRGSAAGMQSDTRNVFLMTNIEVG